MNRTKKIYFLFSFVMIIACYALNKSYSLFIDSKEQNVVDSKVPNLVSELSVNNITLNSEEEYLIKETITNTSEVPINYALNSTGSNYTIKITTDEDNNVLGSLEPNTSSIVYLYVKNDSTSSNTITFNLNKKYTTLNNDLTSNIDTTDKYTPITAPGIPYSDEPETLKYKILYNYMNSDLYTPSTDTTTGTTTGVEAFKNTTSNKLKLPISSSEVIKLSEITDFTSGESTEKGLYQTEDDYGTRYYFRGASTKNYVSFANYVWRIVRINGDGSIRLILNSETDGPLDFDNSSYSNNTYIGDNAYIGYMFGLTNQTTYDKTHRHVVKSNIMKSIDNWYESYIGSQYEKYLADNLFCGDKTLATSNNTSQSGYGTNTTYYAAYDRDNNKTPTLECAKGATNTYSRYSYSTSTTTKGVSLSKDLTHPIGMLSYDEVVFAGAGPIGSNGNGTNTYYLNDSTLNYDWWTMTPEYYDSGYPYIFTVDDYTGHIKHAPSYCGGTSCGQTYRPVINLKAEVLATQDGTKTNPYEIKLEGE